MLQGSLLYVVNTSAMPDLEKEAARVFVSTMVPHVVETAITGIAAEKKAADIMASVMSRQPPMVVNNVEAILAEATKKSWKCW